MLAAALAGLIELGLEPFSDQYVHSPWLGVHSLQLGVRHQRGLRHLSAGHT